MKEREILVGGNHYFVWHNTIFLGIGMYDARYKVGRFSQFFKKKDGDGYNHFTLFGNYWELATSEEAEQFYKESEEFHN